ncbi:MAG: GDSL-type esterase/lipase family protein [Bacteroidota bacterium]
MNRLLIGVLFVPWWLPWVMGGEEKPLPPAAFEPLSGQTSYYGPMSMPWEAAAQLDRYPFLNLDQNSFLNYSQSISQVYELLRQLESGQRRTINIVHIGDSHLQADWFSGHVRMALHKRFGSAGRGLIFPYKLAKTNSPPDIKVSTNISWNSRRNINRSGSLPIGISGITAHTNYRDFSLEVGVGENEFGIDYAFNKITFFTDKGPRNYDLSLSKDRQQPQIRGVVAPAQQALYHKVKAGENLSLISRKYRTPISDLQRLNRLTGTTIYAGQNLLVRPAAAVPRTPSVQVPGMEGELASVRLSSHSLTPFTSTVYLDEQLESVMLRGQQRYPTQSQTTLYGMVLENYDRRGILYHMIGVNGAQFEHYNAADYFFPQLRELNPDLIIVSLGTNESHNPAFRPETFFKQVDAFTHRIEQEAPLAQILFTTPADAWKGGRSNPRVQQARGVLTRYGLENGHGVWDFYDVMGGEESIQSWYQSGLAARDRLHLSKEGYILQARLFYEAFEKGYNAYLAGR